MSQGYTITKYNKDYKELWDNFVQNSKNGTFLFYRNFMDYHKDRFKDESLLVFQNQKLVAILPANKVDDSLYSHQGLSYGGLLVERKMKFEIFLQCIKTILQYLDSSKIKYLYLKPIPNIYAIQASQEIEYLLKILNAKLEMRHILSVIDLTERIKINPNRLEGKKRGRKHNLKVKEENNFRDFWNAILIPNLSTKHQVKPVHNLDEIEQLHKKFPKNIRQFNVYNGKQIVAGTTIFETKMVAHSQYISGNEDNNILGSLDLLYCYLIEEVFKDKRYFDFGTSNINNGSKVNKGLLYWKEGFGARSAIQNFYSLETKNHPLLDDILV